MQTFLSITAHHLVEKYHDEISDISIILPSRRAGLFLKTEIAKAFGKPLWSPKIFSIEDFMASLSGLKKIDNTTLLFTFYEVYKKIEKEKAQSFDEFIYWAQVLLHDYNEIDSYLVDTVSLFAAISDVRAIDVWNISGIPPTDFQKKYLQFWQSLNVYYTALKKHLLENNIGYQGLIFRLAAENINDRLSTITNPLVFAGFNALSRAEEKIISTLLDSGKAEILWDADDYYVKDKNQEAGRFLRKYIGKDPSENLLWKSIKKSDRDQIKWNFNSLSNEAKKISVIGVPYSIGQARAAGDILKSISPDKITKTAVVLADEKLLIPVLNAIPETIEHVNVTMGYPLKNSAAAGLTEAFFLLQENARKLGRENDFKFYFKDIIRLLAHPVIKKLKAKNRNTAIVLNTIEHKIIKGNRVFIGPQEIDKIIIEYGSDSFCSMLFADWQNNAREALENISGLLEIVYGELLSDEKKIQNVLETEQFALLVKVINQVKNYIQNFQAFEDIKTLKVVFNQLLAMETTPFYGEPLLGLQVMGMLETRTLDFENIILLSTNEGTLPSGKSNNSFLPYDIKKNFKLPVYTEKDAVFAYHFYRMIQRAKNIFTLYNTETDELGSGEKSRFLLQVIEELPKINPSVEITEQIVAVNLPASNKKQTLAINKQPDMLKKLTEHAEYGFSPSALTTYINCPLDFYFKYVAGLRVEQEIEETIEASTMGSFIHEALNELYKLFVGKVLEPINIDSIKPQVKTELKKAFNKKFSDNEVLKGKNFLTFHIASGFINNFLDFEKQSLEKSKIPVMIHSLEKVIEAEKDFHLNGKTIKIKFRGTADRMDASANNLRILDYKTGNVDPKELKLDDIEDLLLPEKSKSLQLLMYSYISSLNQDHNDKEITPGIICLKKISAGIMHLNFANNSPIDEKVLEKFENLISRVLEELFNAEIPFEHRDGAEYCTFCKI
jgi:ATP-dependent helicase/nuclease subunit B